MKAELPRIAVVIPAYNHARLVRRSIESVLAQEGVEVELVVIDDGSRDQTWAEIQRLLTERPGAFVAVRQENAGICRTLNRAVSLTSAPWIAALASDDYFLPGKLRKQAAVLARSPAVGLVHSSGYLDYQNGSPLEDMTGGYVPAIGACLEGLLTQEVRVVAPSMLFTRAAFDAVGGFDASLRAEDIDFFVRLAAAGFEFQFIAEPLIVKTSVEGSAGKDARGLVEVHRLLLEKQRHLFSAARFTDIERRMYGQLVGLAVGVGDLQTALELARAQKSLRAYGPLALRVVRGQVLDRLPPSLRHSLRLLRSRVRARFIG